MLVLLAALGGCSGGSPVVGGTDVPGFVSRDLIDVTSPDRVFAVEHPLFEDATAVDWIPARSPVIVVREGDAARAYPISILMRYPVVDDQLAGRAIAVTYSAPADAAAVWDRTVGSRALTLRGSGKVYRSDAVLFDRETTSLWPQLTGLAVAGPMKGTRLSLLPSHVSSFEEFRTAHPHGEVLARPNPGVLYERNPYAGYRDSGAPPPDYLLVPPGVRAPAMARLIVGFQGGRAFAALNTPCPALPTLEMRGGDPAADPLDADLIAEGRDQRTATVVDPVTGLPQPSLTALASVWLALRPDTLLVCAPAALAGG